MSKVRKLRLDVYGRFRADVIRHNGTWTAYRLGDDGKRSLLRDLVIDADADPEAVVAAFEAVYHELGGPERELEVLSVVMG
ncbi:MAG: hypothetical protein KC731_32865 [Myxococcales bacterium]|nr:hypothetical protein [Myxococcales bacterium]